MIPAACNNVIQSITINLLDLLRYRVRIWEQWLNNGNTGLLPAIIPVVFYHGAARWGVKRQFAETVRNAPGLRRYVPTCEYHLVDVSGYRDEELRGAAMLQVALLALKYSFPGRAAGAVAGDSGTVTGVGAEFERTGFHSDVVAVSGAGGGNGPVERGGVPSGGDPGVEWWRRADDDDCRTMGARGPGKGPSGGPSGGSPEGSPGGLVFRTAIVATVGAETIWRGDDGAELDLAGCGR